MLLLVMIRRESCSASWRESRESGVSGSGEQEPSKRGRWSALGSGGWAEAAGQRVRRGLAEAGLCWLSEVVERAVGSEVEEEEGCLQGSVRDMLNLIELSQNPGKDC